MTQPRVEKRRGDNRKEVTYKQEMLERVWRKGNPHTLLEGMQFDVATVKDKLEIPQKQLKIELPHDPGTPVLRIYPDKTTM